MPKVIPATLRLSRMTDFFPRGMRQNPITLKPTGGQRAAQKKGFRLQQLNSEAKPMQQINITLQGTEEDGQTIKLIVGDQQHQTHQVRIFHQPA